MMRALRTAFVRGALLAPVAAIAAAVLLLGLVTLGVGSCTRHVEGDPAPATIPCPPEGLVCIPI